MNDTDKKSQEAFDKWVKNPWYDHEHKKVWNAALAWHIKEVVEPLEKEMEDIKEALDLAIEERDLYRIERDEWRECAGKLYLGSDPTNSYTDAQKLFENLNQKYPRK